MNQPLLSILIPTTTDRAELFQGLLNELTFQIQRDGLEDIVDIDWECDNKEMSVGAKRDILYKRAKGEYSWQIDDDDYIHSEGIKLIVEALQSKPCCVTFQELCQIDGVIKHSNFSLQYPDWHDNPDWPAGFHYARMPFFKTPIKTALCQQIGVADLRFAEDHDFSRRIKPLLKHEVHISEFVYHYVHWSTDHNERYGFDKDKITAL